jgi:SAM-dependent methyltransferase
MPRPLAGANGRWQDRPVAGFIERESKMTVANMWKRTCELVRVIGQEPRQSFGVFRNVGATIRSSAYAARWPRLPSPGTPGTVQANHAPVLSPNPLLQYFDAHQSGKGIFKWRHYFEIYHRHFAKFVGREVHLLEIGIFSGGSLEMWRAYFGPGCHVYGVDIEPACRNYEGDGVKIFIGDQSDRAFWKSFREQVPVLDILVDDGGHAPDQQIITLEEMLPHLRPGGVYLCEDVSRVHHHFAAFVAGLADNLNAWTGDPHFSIPAHTLGFQSQIDSIHQYPFVTVIEKCDRPKDWLISERRGTQWQPPSWCER